ncbi:MAG: tRNA pseudouridine38-40 synthase [Lentisphaeria bacterium]|jgi:tRNA pseudouridine38-40 synthase
MYKRNCELKSGIVFPEGMSRIALGIEYNGAGFSGFQKQLTAANTVQSSLEMALSKIANEEISLICAGRTDAGVHATEQVVHFDTAAIRLDRAWVQGANTQLPDEVRVHWAKPVAPEFHARFSAMSRTYRYVAYCGEVRPASLNKQVTWTKYDLDQEKMQSAARFLEGEHDFSSFRASQCQAKSPIRRIEHINFFQKNRLLVMEVKANAFLHHMVRNIVGVLMEVGRGAKSSTWPLEILQLKDRTKAAATASPSGLYLVKVEYPLSFNLPRHPVGPMYL